jgi:predicted DNA-binding ribbon-helix-helix protein
MVFIMKAKHPPGLSLNRSLVLKRSIVTDGRKTSISLEDAFWNALTEIAANKHNTVHDLVTKIEKDRTKHKHINLSSVIRLFVLNHYRLLAELKRVEK